MMVEILWVQMRTRKICAYNESVFCLPLFGLEKVWKLMEVFLRVSRQLPLGIQKKEEVYALQAFKCLVGS